MASDITEIDEDIRIANDIWDTLRGNSNYSKLIKSLSVYNRRGKVLEVDVVAALSDPDEKRSLGELLSGIAESYAKKDTTILFHQFNPDNYKPAPNPALTLSIDSPNH